jgi:hypothetical protein
LGIKQSCPQGGHLSDSRCSFCTPTYRSSLGLLLGPGYEEACLSLNNPETSVRRKPEVTCFLPWVFFGKEEKHVFKIFQVQQKVIIGLNGAGDLHYTPTRYAGRV